MKTALIVGTLTVLSLTGCGTTTIRTVPVEVVRVERVPVPSELTEPCSGPDWSTVATFREALEAALKERAARKECEARLAAIRELKPL
jgi:hypothetical protein